MRGRYRATAISSAGNVLAALTITKRMKVPRVDAAVVSRFAGALSAARARGPFTEAAHSVNLSSKPTASAHDSPQAYWCG